MFSPKTNLINKTLVIKNQYQRKRDQRELKDQPDKKVRENQLETDHKEVAVVEVKEVANLDITQESPEKEKKQLDQLREKDKRDPPEEEVVIAHTEEEAMV